MDNLFSQGEISNGSRLILRGRSKQALAFFAGVSALMFVYPIDYTAAYMQANAQWPERAEWQPDPVPFPVGPQTTQAYGLSNTRGF